MSAPLRPGDRLGPYRVVRELGRGGMGAVYEAVDLGLHRSVALKVITHALADDPAFRARFTHEAQAQASLDSPHVVTVYAYGEVEGLLYIATQLIPDGDLGAMFRAHGAPPPRIAVSMIAQIADGLAEAHRVGLVHRDIKPANVLLRNRGNEIAAYLADFGIARRVGPDNGLSGLTTEGFAIGTPSYMAPELHTGGAPGPASDIYSLGCLLWACLTGRAPYGGTTDYQVVAAHVSAPVPQLAGRSAFEREVNRILARAMAKDPAHRYIGAAALRDDLRAVERTLDAPVEVGSAATTGRDDGAAATPTRSRLRTAMIGGGALAAVVLLGIGIGAAFALAGGDDRSGPPSAASSSASDQPTDQPTDQPSGGSSGTPTPDPDLSREEEIAVANLTALLSTDSQIDEPTARCVARELVLSQGVDGLQEAGILDEDLQVLEDGAAADPDLFSDVFSLAFDCVLDSGGP